LSPAAKRVPRKPADAGKAGRSIDLDAARAARAEAAAEPVSLTFGGKTIELPVEMPADFALQLADGDFRGAVTALLDKETEWFFDLRPSLDDLKALADGASEVYGLTEGESEASPST
jgi:hypothetical protein